MPFTTRTETKVGELQAWGRIHGVAELAIPGDIRFMDALPVLRSGKLDYFALATLARDVSTGSKTALQPNL